MSLAVGDVGTHIDITIVEDDGTTIVPLNPGTDNVEYRLKLPSGVVKKRTGTITDGPNGEVRYTLQAGDIDEEGQLTIQLYVNLVSSSWAGSSDLVTEDTNGKLLVVIPKL